MGNRPDEEGGDRLEVRGVLAHPIRTAVVFGLVYLVVFLLYINVSDALAEAAADTKEELNRIQRIKGFVFIFAMSLAVFFATWLLIKHSARDARTILAQEKAIAETARRAMVGAFAASVAHDIRNVVMIASLEVSTLAKQEGDDQTKETIQHLSEVVKRIRDLSWRLLMLGRESLPGAPEVLDLGSTIRDGVDLAKGHQKLLDCELRVDTARDLVLRGHRSAIQEMLLNLMLNAADANSGRGKVEVRAYALDDDRIVEVHDDGPGIPEDGRDEVFRAFYTSKKEGTGLGLVSVRACAEVHGGSVEITESPLGGACFRVRLTSAE